MKERKNGLFSVMTRIEGMSNQFTKTDWKIVQYMKENMQEFVSCSAQDLATQIGVSDASVIRFAQKVGFSGLNEFRYILQSELERENTIINQNSYTSLMHDYNTLTETLFKFTKPEYVDLLRKKMLKARRIFIAGMDLNKNIAEMAGHKFMLLGLDVLPEYQHQGLARKLMEQYKERERARGRKKLILTCLPDKVEMYKKFGFKDHGIGDSVWGGEAWHEMDIVLE